MGDVERWAKARDLHIIAGLDEAGRGPLAGPVVAACVVLPPGTDRRQLRGLDDSKKLSESSKERLYDRILPLALASKVAFASRAEIDELNILQASLLAMKRAFEGALEQLPDDVPRPQLVAVDGRQTIDCRYPQRAFVKGDSRSHNIAAASVLAKVARDRHMARLDEIYPGYGFAKHKGYPTAQHRAAIARLGPCAEHRTTFRLLPT